jgi:type III pantothenate kinase
MILEFDCGNTRIKWRVRDGSHIVRRGFFLTSDTVTAEMIDNVESQHIKRVLISSVLSAQQNQQLLQAVKHTLRLVPEFALSVRRKAGIINGYEPAEKLGVDRWLAMVAAKKNTQKPLVVVDCGSAITVDVVSSQGFHLGGYIAPGLALMRKSLSGGTAAIQLSNMSYPQHLNPGRNTQDAIFSAEFIMIKALIDQAKKCVMTNESSEPALWVTGGDGEWLSSLFEGSVYVEDLVMDGLVSVFEQRGMPE